jgi:hypothetical protein
LIALASPAAVFLLNALLSLAAALVILSWQRPPSTRALPAEH